MSEQQPPQPNWGPPPGPGQPVPPRPASPPGSPPGAPPSYGQPVPPAPAQPPPTPPGQFPPPAQPPGFGQPAANPYAAPPKRRLTWLWVLLGILGLFVLVVGGCSLFVFNLARGPIDGANEWVALVDDGNYTEAYNELCQPARNAFSEADVVTSLEENFGAGISGYNFSSVASVNGRTTVEGSIQAGGLNRNVIFDMVEEDGDWKVCSLP